MGNTLPNPQREKQYQIIIDAKPNEKYRGPHPLGDIEFPDLDFIKYNVIQDKKDIKLWTYRFPSQTKEIQGIIIIFHGLNAYVGSFAHCAKKFAEKGFEVVGFDHRGFGKSQGTKGYIHSLKQHIEDAKNFVTLIEGVEKYKGKKITLLGQSLGGLTAYNLGLQEPKRYNNIVLYAPAIRDNENYKKWGKNLACILGTIMPSIPTIAPNKEESSANRNPKVFEDSLKNPNYYQGNVIPGTIKQLLNGMSEASKTFEKFDIPFLVIQGGIDKLIDPFASEDLVKLSPQKDKELMWYPEVWHNIWHEPEIVEITERVISWIEKRV